jgi:DNA helicase II / ATP-dependent DNA helicase PcrA
MVDFQEKYKLLNKEQKEVVDTIEGPVLVVAGPGSGKTEVLGIRVANILKKTDISPGNILCLTFTDSAAVNMRDRLKEIIGQDAFKVAIHTFHNFGVDIINYHPEIFYKGAVFSPADELTQLDLLEGIFSKLKYDNPLKKIHPEQGYTYLRSVQKSIQYLKKAGLTPEEFNSILDHNESSLSFLNPLVGEYFKDKIKKENLKTLPELIVKIKRYKQKKFPVNHMKSLVSFVTESLEHSLEKALEKEETKPLSEWKRERIYKNEDGDYLLKETKHLEKMRALAEVYGEYRKLMYAQGYYDFDDMILDTLTAIEKNSELRYELQEQFQYILVDEFQDTNDAQMRLLRLLTSADVHEGRPNIMAVGDDDQAIFKFQGAEISNILKFKEYYRDPKIITMVKNYRSRQDILDVARYIITQGKERLENVVPEVNKILKSVNDGIAEGEIKSKSFPTIDHEYIWIANEVKKLIDKGLEPDNIGIIARKHNDLKILLPYLEKKKIPVSYEAQRNVLQELHIRQIIQISRLVISLLEKNKEVSDDLLPEILSYPFWDIERKIIWEISRKAYKNKESWIDVMLNHKSKKINEIADFFLFLAKLSKYEPVDRVIEKIIGAKVHALPDSEDDDFENKDKEKYEYISPFKDYYFSQEKFKKDPDEYLIFLSALRTFVYALREYKQGQIIGLQDMINFVETHENNNMVLSDNGIFLQSRNTVNLLTAHKAKGMEFDTVFILNCQDDIWAGKRQGSRLPFPSNLPITPAGDNKDDQLRLFYVAVTRAIRRLYFTSYEMSNTGKEDSRLQFISSPNDEKLNKVNKFLSPEIEKDNKEKKIEKEILTSPWGLNHYPPFLKDEKILLKSILENYKLNVTHMNNFLNVVDGGPQLFLEQNLLRFPQPKSVSLSYGSAMHQVLHQIYEHLKKTKRMPNKNKIIDWFEKFLKNQRLNKHDFAHYFKRGKEALTVFLEKNKNNFKIGHFSEFSFKQEGVVIKETPITGKIDKMETIENEIIVYDFKTGKYSENWKGSNEREKIKLWKYKNQLIFYKLLVENSRKFGGNYKVEKGFIEFLEPKNKKEIVSLPLVIEEKEVDRLERLIIAVYKKIINLDFPETKKYSKDIKGIKEFEDSLI